MGNTGEALATNKKWQQHYQTGNTPWDSGRFDRNLTELVANGSIPPSKTLEVGCGTGSNAIWLTQNGFEVTGTDISEDAINLALQKVTDAGVNCTLMVADFMTNDVPGAPFQLVFDRGCFHTMETDQERDTFAQRVALHLGPKGLWLSLIGSADSPPRDVGPPQRTARDIVIAVEAYFEVLSLTSGYFDLDRPHPPKAWICLMQKRG